MYTVSIRTEFNAAHRLRDYHGKCESLHGHNWSVEVTIQNKVLDKSGMVVDFSDIKQDVSRFLEQLDHKFLNELVPFKEINPTSENIAKFIYDGLKSLYQNLIRVTVWETPTNCATYEPST